MTGREEITGPDGAPRAAGAPRPAQDRHGDADEHQRRADEDERTPLAPIGGDRDLAGSVIHDITLRGERPQEGVRDDSCATEGSEDDEAPPHRLG